jgi:GT2 family glycosyltransferase
LGAGIRQANALEERKLTSVVIITRNRPGLVHQCLDRLLQQDYGPFETIVVDASSNQQTEEIVKQYPVVRYIYLPNGKNKMGRSRNLGIEAAKGEVIAFIDDDSMVRDGWLSSLISCYNAEDIGGVGGRVIDEIELKYQIAAPVVGRVFPDGRVIDNFALELNGVIEVDRLKGCNMSFRKHVLQEVGLFDEYYDNTWDDVDICTRVKKGGYRLLFNPRTVVDHLAAPREDGLPRSVTNPRVMFSYYRNRTYFVFANFGWIGWHLVSLFGRDSAEYFYWFLKNFSVYGFRCLVANIWGKIVGTVAALEKQFAKNG